MGCTLAQIMSRVQALDPYKREAFTLALPELEWRKLILGVAKGYSTLNMWEMDDEQEVEQAVEAGRACRINTQWERRTEALEPLEMLKAELSKTGWYWEIDTSTNRGPGIRASVSDGRTRIEVFGKTAYSALRHAYEGLKILKGEL